MIIRNFDEPLLSYNGDLNFAPGTDMSLLEAGDKVKQETVSGNPDTWIEASASGAKPWQSVAYGDGKFVAVAGGLSSSDRVMYSLDGISWFETAAAADNTWRSVTYGEGKFVAIAQNGTNCVMYSSDGITWDLSAPAPKNQWKSVTYGDNKFVAVADNGTSDRAMYSSDGINWNLATPTQQVKWNGVTYGELPDGTKRFVAVTSGGTHQPMYSSDGINWNASFGAEDKSWSSVTYGDGKFVAVAQNHNTAMYSLDGVQWTTSAVIESISWESVTYGDGTFVAVASSGINRVMYSLDGITWTPASAAENNPWQGVTYGNSKFVAVADSGTHQVMYSSVSPSGIVGSITDTIVTLASDTSGWVDGVNVTGPEKEVPIIRDNDTFLVNRSGNSYQVEAQNLMSIQDTDLMLVNRGGQSYKVTGAEVKGELGGGGSGLPSFNIDECFASFVYTGNGTTQTFDLGPNFNCSAGCLILIAENAAGAGVTYHADTAQGVDRMGRWSANNIPSNSEPGSVTSFNTNGFTIGNNSKINTNGTVYRCQVFKEQPGFFNITTYDGDGTEGRSIPHGLGAEPAMMVFRNQNASFQQAYMYCKPAGNSSSAQFSQPSRFVATQHFLDEMPTDTEFIPGSQYINIAPHSYVAYIWGGDPNGSSDYPSTFGSYRGASIGPRGFSTQFLTGKSKAQFFVISLIEAGNNSSASHIYFDKASIDDNTTYSRVNGWNNNTTESSRVLTAEDGKVRFTQAAPEVNANTGVYFYYCINRG